MKTSFLFMDDWSYPPDKGGTAMCALTGILVPIAQYAKLRTKFYHLLKDRICLQPNTIMNPPELHGCNMLRDEPDEKKLQMYSLIARFILENKIQVYRLGTYVTKTIRETFKNHYFGINTCWFNMLIVLQHQYQNECIIPVMDTCNPDVVPMFSAMVKQMDVMRAAGMGDSLSLANSENILGEVFFADSRFAAFVQIVDVVGYLRSMIDLEREGWKFSPFKKKVLKIGKSLRPAMVYEEMLAITVDGILEGPRRNKRFDRRGKSHP
jgi:hypothetical protein